MCEGAGEDNKASDNKHKTLSITSAQLSSLAAIRGAAHERQVEEEGQQKLERSSGRFWCNSVFLFVVLRNCR